MAKLTADQIKTIREQKRKADEAWKLARRLAGDISDAERMSQKRAAERDLVIPDRPANPERRAALLHDDEGWLRTYLPRVFYHPFTESRKQLIAEISTCLRLGTRKCVAAPRGDGKSTITKYLALKYALEGVVEYLLILAATSNKAEKMLGDLKRQMRNPLNKELREDYPLQTIVARYVGSAPSKANNCTGNGGRPIGVKWTQDLLVLPRWEDEGLGGIVQALGITSDAVQGANYNDIRPSFVILDDLDSRDSLAAVDGKIADKIETIVDHTVAGLGGPGRRLGQTMLCTIPSRNSVAFRYSDPTEKPAWSGVRLARIQKWPDHKADWDEYVHLRQRGKQTMGPNGKPVDPTGREAHRFYEANYERMNFGAELSNEHDYESDEMPDGSPKHLSALQKCWDYIADNGMASFLTEHQNDPPEDDAEASRLGLTEYAVQQQRLSGLERRMVPRDAVLLTRGADIRKVEAHWVVIAWSAAGAGSIVDYGAWKFGTDDLAAADCELEILKGLRAWRDWTDDNPYTREDGEVVPIGLTLVDTGWKDESWNTQPVTIFCAESGAAYLPSKGQPNYRRPAQSDSKLVGDHWHIEFPGRIVMMNSDHWKLKVHEGFLLEPQQPGALTLFNHPILDGKVQRNFHHGYSRHILAEVWETRVAPGFKRPETRWWYSGRPNHYLDATYAAIVARSVRGLNPVRGTVPRQSAAAAKAPAPPPPTAKQQDATQRHSQATQERRRVNFRR